MEVEYSVILLVSVPLSVDWSSAASIVPAAELLAVVPMLSVVVRTSDNVEVEKMVSEPPYVLVLPLTTPPEPRVADSVDDEAKLLLSRSCWTKGEAAPSADLIRPESGHGAHSYRCR